VERKLAELQRTIDLRKNEGLARRKQGGPGGFRKTGMDQVRAIIAEMANEERNLLGIRHARGERERGQVGAHHPHRTLLSISLVVLCFGLLQRELSRK